MSTLFINYKWKFAMFLKNARLKPGVSRFFRQPATLGALGAGPVDPLVT